MSILSQVFNTPSNKSKFRQYLFVTLGPFFVLGALIAFLSKWSLSYSMLSLLVVASLPAIWKYKIKGALFSSLFVLATFFGISIFSESSMSFSWLLFLCLSFCVSLVLAGICSKHYHEIERSLEEEREKRAFELKEGYESKEKRLKTELLHIEDEKLLLEESIKKCEAKISSFKDLVIASKEESDKYFMQSEHLSKRMLEMQKETALIEQQKIALQHIGMKNKGLQKRLNEERVHHFQKNLLFENLLKKEGTTVPKAVSEEVSSEELEMLKEERKKLIELYETAFRNYQALKEKLQNYFTMDRLSSFSEDAAYEKMYEELKETFTSRAKELQAMRSDIFKLEGQLIEMRASLNSDSSMNGYLVIADQECLRLEEENALFLDLFVNTLSLLEEKKASTALSESHSHPE